MSDDQGQISEQALDLAEQKRFRSSIALLTEALNACQVPAGRALLAYNLGAVYWGETGNGMEARRQFQQTVDEGDKALLAHSQANVRKLQANACENLMLLSLSYDEYVKWANRLELLQPKNDILLGQRPMVLEWQDQGQSWSDTLQVMASAYYNRNDASKDPGRYGSALSTFQVLLRNRKALHLPRKDWGNIIYETGALGMRIVADSMKAMTAVHGGFDPNEMAFIVEDVQPLVEEYTTAHPDDEKIQNLHSNLQSFIRETSSPQPLARAEIALNPTPMHSQRPDRAGSNAIPPFAVLSGAIVVTVVLTLIGAAIGWGVDKLMNTTRGVTIGAAIGASLGSLGILSALTITARGFACTVCGRPCRKVSPEAMHYDVNSMMGLGMLAMSGEPGRECRTCGRIICSSCDQSVPCPCGMGSYRVVRLQ